MQFSTKYVFGITADKSCCSDTATFHSFLKDVLLQTDQYGNQTSFHSSHLYCLTHLCDKCVVVYVFSVIYSTICVLGTARIGSLGSDGAQSTSLPTWWSHKHRVPIDTWVILEQTIFDKSYQLVAILTCAFASKQKWDTLTPFISSNDKTHISLKIVFSSLSNLPFSGNDNRKISF